jgi:hypothetical protein
MTIINSSEGNDALSQEKIVIVSAEPLVDWEILGDLTSIEIIFSNAVNDNQPQISSPNPDSNCVVNDEIDGEDTFFSEDEIVLRFRSHDRFGFGLSC